MGQDCCKSLFGAPTQTINTEKNSTTAPTKELSVYDNNVDPFRIVKSDDISRLKKTYDKVLDAIGSIPPKYRDELSSYPVIVADSDISGENAQKAKSTMIERINRDLQLNNEIPLSLTTKINNMFDNTWAKEYREDYAEINLSSDYGGTSLIRVGFVAFKRYKTDLIIALCLHFEKWTEQDNVKINKTNPVWCKQNVEDFAKYLLYKKIGKDFKEFIEAKKKSIDHKLELKEDEDKRKMKDELNRLKQKLGGVKNNKATLDDWLNDLGLKQYYNNFKGDGFDRMDDITDIDVSNDKMLKSLGITKTGHINRLTKAINKLKTTTKSDNKAVLTQKEGDETEIIQ
eukprot:84555_1